jgi:uncharacterized protein
MDESLHTLVLAIDCRIHYAQSLKQKRAAIKGVIDRLRARLNASVAEVGYLDEWQRSLIGVAMISNNRRYLQQQSDLVAQILLEATDIEIIHIESHWP